MLCRGVPSSFAIGAVANEFNEAGVIGGVVGDDSMFADEVSGALKGVLDEESDHEVVTRSGVDDAAVGLVDEDVDAIVRGRFVKRTIRRIRKDSFKWWNRH